MHCKYDSDLNFTSFNARATQSFSTRCAHSVVVAASDEQTSTPEHWFHTDVTPPSLLHLICVFRWRRLGNVNSVGVFYHLVQTDTGKRCSFPLPSGARWNCGLHVVATCAQTSNTCISSLSQRHIFLETQLSLHMKYFARLGFSIRTCARECTCELMPWQNFCANYELRIASERCRYSTIIRTNGKRQLGSETSTLKRQNRALDWQKPNRKFISHLFFLVLWHNDVE